MIKDKIKAVEIRTWKTKYRGKLLIHAGKSVDKKALQKYKEFIDKENIYSGKIIAECILKDCVLITNEYIEKHNKENKNYKLNYKSLNKYAWELENVNEIEEKVSINGKLSLWNFN